MVKTSVDSADLQHTLGASDIRIQLIVKSTVKKNLMENLETVEFFRRHLQTLRASSYQWIVQKMLVPPDSADIVPTDLRLNLKSSLGSAHHCKGEMSRKHCIHCSRPTIAQHSDLLLSACQKDSRPVKRNSSGQKMNQMQFNC